MRMLHQHYEVIVCGGGLSGVCAAIAAARNGARVCIVQDRPVFGGNSSSEIRVIPQGAANFNAYARETGIVSELLLEERAMNHEPNRTNGRTNSVWDMILYNKIVSESNLDFYLNTSIYEVVMDPTDSRIEAIRARIANAETELNLKADLFIDCTGDGIVADLSGCEWRMGTESRDEYGEPHAPTIASTDVMGSSIHFRAKDMGRPIPFKAPEWAYNYDDPAVFYKGGRIPSEPEGGYWWIELGSPWDTILDNETIRHELTRHVLGIWDFLKNKDIKFMERAKNFAIDWIGQIPGKRESRRIMGMYMLTQHDIMERRNYDDDIAYGGWFIDLHKSGGLLAAFSEQGSAKGDDSNYMNQSYVAPYSIPLRCLIAKDVENLFMAGRNISATHVALGSTRVMGTTAILGQAAGTAAAIVLRTNEKIKKLSLATIQSIQQRLLRDDCFLMGATNEDPMDLARCAKVEASSSTMITEVKPVPTVDVNRVDRNDTIWRLLTRHSQWFIRNTDHIESISVFVSNLSSTEQWLDISLLPVDDIWDYRVRHRPSTISDRLAVQPGCGQWIQWDVSLHMPTSSLGRYMRIELGPNSDIIWHPAEVVLPGLPAAYETNDSRMRRLGNGETLSFAIKPAQDMYPASHLTSGVARPYQTTNLWRSDPRQTMPQWIQLSWNKTQYIQLIQLTFPGQLRMDYRYYPPLYRDPECPKRYVISAQVEGEWQELIHIDDNYQRQCRHKLPSPIHTCCLRVTILETNGDDSAAIYEIRVYAD